MVLRTRRSGAEGFDPTGVVLSFVVHGARDGDGVGAVSGVL